MENESKNAIRKEQVIDQTEDYILQALQDELDEVKYYLNRHSFSSDKVYERLPAAVNMLYKIEIIKAVTGEGSMHDLAAENAASLYDISQTLLMDRK